MNYLNKYSALICFLTIFFNCNNVMAEKWEWVYRNFRLNYYVDVDSISRDNGKIIAKTSAIPVCETPLGRDDPKLFFSSETTAEFNCEDGSHQ